MQAQYLVSSWSRLRVKGSRPQTLRRSFDRYFSTLERPEKKACRISQLNPPIKEEAVNKNTLLPREGKGGVLFHDTRQLPSGKRR